MKRPPLLRVDRPPEVFAPLFKAAQAAGLRLGWLDFDENASQPVPDALARAADLGALRAVAVGEGSTVVVKPRRGPAVLDDLLREHFRGTIAVLVRGDVDAPRLTLKEGGTWEVEAPDGPWQGDAEALIHRLRRPPGYVSP